MAVAKKTYALATSELEEWRQLIQERTMSVCFSCDDRVSCGCEDALARHSLAYNIIPITSCEYKLLSAATPSSHLVPDIIAIASSAFSIKKAQKHTLSTVSETKKEASQGPGTQIWPFALRHSLYSPQI